MADSRVVFLALGASRRRVVIEESTQVVTAGGTAVVVVDKASAWRRERFDPRVRVIALAELEQRQRLLVSARRVARMPAVALRTLGRGPLRAASRRMARSYEGRIADQFHRRVVLPAYRRLRGDVRHRLLHRFVLQAQAFDLLVVSDPLSIPVAARLRPDLAGVPPVAYGLVEPASTSDQLSWTA